KTGEVAEHSKDTDHEDGSKAETPAKDHDEEFDPAKQREKEIEKPVFQPLSTDHLVQPQATVNTGDGENITNPELETQGRDRLLSAFDVKKECEQNVRCLFLLYFLFCFCLFLCEVAFHATLFVFSPVQRFFFVAFGIHAAYVAAFFVFLKVANNLSIQKHKKKSCSVENKKQTSSFIELDCFQQLTLFHAFQKRIHFAKQA
ncbi:hypothetical protein RFI_29760, partial [Reticulomyxa filosa]